MNIGVVDAAHEQAEAYRDGEDRPLGGYALTMTAFTAVVAAATAVARKRSRRPPRAVGPWEVLMLSAATHKLSRTITKAAVTAPLRAPFTRFSGPGGPSEVDEEVRATGGTRHAIGELLTCPFCLDVWIATLLASGWVLAPGATRLVAATLAALTGADFLQLAYAKAQQAVD